MMGWIENRPNKFLNKNFVRQGLPAKYKTRRFRLYSLMFCFSRSSTSFLFFCFLPSVSTSPCLHHTYSTMGVYDFYSIVKSIDLIDTCPKKNNPCTGFYIRSKIFVSHLMYLLHCIVCTFLSLERKEALKHLHCNANSKAPPPSPKEE